MKQATLFLTTKQIINCMTAIKIMQDRKEKDMKFCTNFKLYENVRDIQKDIDSLQETYETLKKLYSYEQAIQEKIIES